MSILPKAVHRFSAIPIKIQMTFFHRNRIKSSKIYMEPQKAPNSQAFLRKKNKAGDVTFPDFKLHDKPIVIKTTWY